MHCFRRRLEAQSANVLASASRAQMEMLAGDSSGSAVVCHSDYSEDSLARKDQLWRAGAEVAGHLHTRPAQRRSDNDTTAPLDSVSTTKQDEEGTPSTDSNASKQESKQA